MDQLRTAYTTILSFPALSAAWQGSIPLFTGLYRSSEAGKVSGKVIFSRGIARNDIKHIWEGLRIYWRTSGALKLLKK